MVNQDIFQTCYRGRQSSLHHMAYMRMSKVLLALRTLDRLGLNLSGKSLFDYGFGAGTFFRYCPPDCDLYGVEQDENHVITVAKMLEQRGYGSVHLQTISIEAWRSNPLLNRSYDVFLCSHVLEHLPNPVDFLSAIKPCLRSDSVFIGLVPLNERAKNPHHLHAPDRNMIYHWAEGAGFKVTYYEENDPFIYWLQPLFTTDKGLKHQLAQAVSLTLGVLSCALGRRFWFALGKIFALITRSRQTQAVFALAVTTYPNIESPRS